MNPVAPVITLNGISKRFDDVLAVDNIDLTLFEGEFFALLGPSGCGKTTLLRMIAGFEQTDTGSINLDGLDITTTRPNRRPVNMMFQSYALFPHLSVRANIAYGLEMEGLPKSTIQERVTDILETIGLSQVTDRKPGQLSGGQRQRVALARALIKQPRVLLLDEPLAALDRKLRGQMQFELKRLQHELGTTFVVVTHDQDEALAMADRIGLMNDGRVVQVATPQELYEAPNSLFVADFIGVSNFITGTYTSGRLQNPTHGALDPGPHDPLKEHSQAVIAVRPEHLIISTDGALPEYNALKGTIVDTVYRGQDINVRVAVIDSVAGFTIRDSSDSSTLAEDYAVGRSVWCNWLPDRGRLLTRQTDTNA